MNEEKSLFAAIISGEIPGNVIVQDDEKMFAIIASIEPEAAIHWLAIPFEYGSWTEEIVRDHKDRFLDLVDFAITQTKALTAEYPLLENGFSIKFHVGSFETIPHPKLHILSAE